MSLIATLRAGLSGIFEAVLADVSAAFVPETTPRAPSTDELGYDLSCIEDIDERAREVAGDEMLVEALARRLGTARGTLGDDDPDYGLDLMSYLSRALTAAELAAIPGLVRGEILKDERVQDVTARVVFVEQESRLELELDGVAATGPFQFTISATADNVTLLVRGEV